MNIFYKLIRILFPVCLFIYFISTTSFSNLWIRPPEISIWIGSLLLLLIDLFLSSYRFSVLTKISLPLPIKKIIRFDLIAHFYSLTFGIGSSGDLSKLHSLKNIFPDEKVFTIGKYLIWDKYYALVGHFLLISICLFFSSLPNYLFIFFITMLLITIFSSLILNHFFPKFSHAKLAFKKKILLIFLSFISQALQSMAFLMLFFKSLSSLKETYNAFCLTAISFLSIPLSFSPGGFGVGHISFDYIFRKFQIMDGGKFFNLYFIEYCLIAFLGFLLTLQSNKKN